MKIGIIGGGLQGMALAYALTQSDHQITVLEQNTQVGGLNSAMQFNPELAVARYPHSILPHDTAIRSLIEDLNLTEELDFHLANTGFLHGGAIHGMSTIWDFLRFTPLKPLDRLRLGRGITIAQKIRDWQTLDNTPARDWLLENVGPQAFARLWEPLLEAKFDYDYDHIPATFVWSWLNRMTAIRQGPHLRGYTGYLQGGHQSLIDALAGRIRASGGQILNGTRVREIELDGERVQRVRTQSGIMQFDLVVAALPSPMLARLIPGADERYLAALEQSRYLGLVCPVLVLDRPLSGYWTLNLTDPSSPFSSIIETPHPTAPGLHLVYLPKYTAPAHDWMGVPDSDIKAAWLLRLRQLFPDLKPESIQHFAVNRSRYVEPVHTLNAASHLLPVETPYAGLLLVNSSQVYPALATSESVIRHAQAAAEIVLRQRSAAVLAESAA